MAAEPDDLIDAASWEKARAVIEADLEAAEGGPFTAAIPPGQMPKFQREWRPRPELRLLIRTADDLEEQTASASKSVRALREMSKSPEWRRDPGGRMPFPEFHRLL